MALDLYVFSSTSRENIEIGVNRRIWAVPISKTRRMRRQFETKAAQMPVGSHGIFYLSGEQLFTGPFIVASRPKPNVTVTGIWDGDFFLPFRIHPLSEAWPLFPKAWVKRMLPSLSELDENWHTKLRVKANQAFVASKLSVSDWEVLVEKLAPVESYQLV